MGENVLSTTLISNSLIASEIELAFIFIDQCVSSVTCDQWLFSNEVLVCFY